MDALVEQKIVEGNVPDTSVTFDVLSFHSHVGLTHSVGFLLRDSYLRSHGVSFLSIDARGRAPPTMAMERPTGASNQLRPPRERFPTP